MKKFILIFSLITLPFLASAHSSDLVTNYTNVMSKRLAFGLNRNARLYNQLVEESKALAREAKDVRTIDTKLAETKIVIDRGQANLAALSNRASQLTASSTPKESYVLVRQLVQGIARDIRQSYVKIREIKLLIKQIPQ